MAIELDLGILITVAGAVVAAWWAIAVLAIKQFERRQEDRFTTLGNSISEQQRDIESHTVRSDHCFAEVRRVEAMLAGWQVESATRFQTKDDAGKQFSQLIHEIRNLGSRIDALHGRSAGIAGGQ